MKIQINRDGGRPIYQQIAQAIEKKIETQELVSGAKLPAERQLATQLQVHRNTVIKAYGELVSRGLVQASRQKPKGYFVEAHQEQNFSQRFFPLEKAFRYEYRRAERKFNSIYWDSDEEDYISFGGMIMDRKIEPVKGMQNALKKIFDTDEGGGIISYIRETERLKENLCKKLTMQNIYVTPKNIQITAETNQTISYLMTLYVRAGECIIAEEPIVPDVSNIFYNRGINVVTVSMEEDGMNLEELEENLRMYKPKFIYTIPNHHNPTGIRMSLNKRKRLLELADTYNVPIIEDDYMNYFQYTENSIPSLYSLDTNKLVVYADSFTLTFPYGVKVGYVVGPADFIDMLGYAISTDETLIANVGQFFLNEYMESGDFERHIDVLCNHFRHKKDLICEQLDLISHKGITYHHPDGGLVIWCTLDKGINERQLTKIAKEKGVLIMPGWIFCKEERQEKGHLRLCFSNATDEKIIEGIRLLGEALDECRK
ncbi:DNA-binding transcriptional MocR family regulator [Clostridiales Family XIII bacterium PM5-7]